MRAALKKMTEAGKLVAGAVEGRKGDGCFKLAPEEKMLRLKAAKKALEPVKKAAAMKKVAMKKSVSTAKAVKAAKKKKPAAKPGKKPSLRSPSQCPRRQSSKLHV